MLITLTKERQKRRSYPDNAFSSFTNVLHSQVRVKPINTVIEKKKKSLGLREKFGANLFMFRVVKMADNEQIKLAN